MEKLLPIISLIFSMLLLSCSGDFTDKNSRFIPLDELKVDQEALPDEEKLNVIYSPEYITAKEEDYSYYVILLAGLTENE